MWCVFTGYIYKSRTLPSLCCKYCELLSKGYLAIGWMDKSEAFINGEASIEYTKLWSNYYHLWYKQFIITLHILTHYYYYKKTLLIKYIIQQQYKVFNITPQLHILTHYYYKKTLFIKYIILQKITVFNITPQLHILTHYYYKKNICLWSKISTTHSNTL